MEFCAYPFPEIVDQDLHRNLQWKVIHEDSVHVSPSGHTLFAPLYDTPESLANRIQGIGRCRWGMPRCPSDVPILIFHAIETARINMILRQHNFDIDRAACVLDVKDKDVDMIWIYTLALLHSHTTIANLNILETAYNLDLQLPLTLYREVIQQLEQDSTHKGAQAAMVWLTDHMPRATKSPSFDYKRKISRWYHLSQESIPWGTLTIEEPDRPIRISIDRFYKTHRAIDRGAYMRHIERYCTDRAIFSTRRMRIGGTLVIDGSSSMSLSAKDIYDIVEAVPAATIAVYSGTGSTGVLRILAKNGTIVQQHLINRPSGGANIVDGPVLEWLGQQASPRLWISDGDVTGIHDIGSIARTLEAQFLQLQYDISRLRTAKEAKTAILAGRARRTLRAVLSNQLQ